MAPKKKEWRSAVDPKTGRTYYYDAITRETQWRKPLELATPEERSRIEETQRKQKEFFRSMEANILKALNRGHVPGIDPNYIEEEKDVVKPLPTTKNMVMLLQHQSGSRKHNKKLVNVPAAATTTTNTTTTTSVSSKNNKPTLIRTISSMDDELIAELTQTHPENHKEGGTRISSYSSPGMISPDCTTTAFFDDHVGDSRPTPTTSFQKSSSYHHPLNTHNPLLAYSTMIPSSPVENFDRFKNSSYVKEHTKQHQGSSSPANIAKGVSKYLEKPIMMKRNTCGSLYINDTMADPDKDACIKVGISSITKNTTIC
jgi:hypothetical protein